MKCKCVLPQQEVGICEACINAYGEYESVCGSVLIFTLVDICISSPPDRALPSITAHPIVRLTAYKQPGNDGALQLVQQQWLINIHIPLSNPLMPIFVSHTLAVSCYSFQREEPNRCPNIWGELWPFHRLCMCPCHGCDELSFGFCRCRSISCHTELKIS